MLRKGRGRSILHYTGQGENKGHSFLYRLLEFRGQGETMGDKATGPYNDFWSGDDMTYVIRYSDMGDAGTPLYSVFAFKPRSSQNTQ